MGVLLGALVPMLVLGGCLVRETEEELLLRLWACQTNADCVTGWECRAFSMDVSGNRYCVLLCGGDGECRAGEICGNEGFCVRECEPGTGTAGSQCGDERLQCLRMNMTAGDEAGYCQPTSPCTQSEDCGQVQSQCVSDIVAQAWPELDLELEQNACIQSCGGGSACSEGFSCVAEVVAQYAPDLEDLPPICVPGCGVDNACPMGLSCLLDALQLLLPNETFNELELKICAPGLPTIELPCGSDRDCMLGYCVRHPARMLDSGDPLYTCAMPCEANSTCAIDGKSCLPTEQWGEPVNFCF